MSAEQPIRFPRASRLAKLTRPRSDGLVQRERLFGVLDGFRDEALVWIAAPGGAGKTSLVASWLAARGRPAIWVQVDVGDADPATFFHYLAAATQGLVDEPVRLPVFTPQDTAEPVRFARRYFRECFALPQDGTVFVLDNLQEAGHGTGWHQMLVAMCEEAPPGIQVLALSRSGLPAELARARLDRRVGLLEWRQLRLQRDEAHAMVNHLVRAHGAGALDGAPVPVDLQAVADRLFEQSQGWAAGLVLLLDHASRTGRLDADAFAGSLESVFDYFAGQVLSASDAGTRDTLLRVSFLPSMEAATVAAVTGRPLAIRVIEDFAQRNLFTDRRPGASPTYQFHALFRSFLQERARREWSPDDVVAAMRRAALALRTAGIVDDAMRLSLEGGDWPSAIAQLHELAEPMVVAGRHGQLADWIAMLPAAMLDASPWLTYWHGVALASRDPPGSRALIERARVRFHDGADRAGEIRAIASLMSGWWAERSSVAWLGPHVDRLTSLLADETGLETRTRAIGLISLARAWLMIRPNDNRLGSFARQLAALPVDALDAELVVGIGCCLIAYHWGIGDSETCTLVARRTMPYADRSDVPVSERLWFLFYLMTHLVYMSDVEAGHAVMEKARALDDASRLSPPYADFVRWNVTFEMQLNRADNARRMIEEELIPILDGASLMTQACIDLEQARVGIEEGKLEHALVHARRGVQLAREGGLGWIGASLGLTLACAQALAGQTADADATLARLRAGIGDELPILRGSVEMYQALSHLLAGDRTAARAALALAVRLREASGYPWGPGWNRPGVARVAEFALREGLHVPAMQRIVEGLRIAPPSPDIEHWPWPVRIEVLDGFSLRIAGQRERPATGKASRKLLELLKAVAAAGGDAVPMDTLADMVWPESDGDLARRSLDTALSRLRKLLHSEDAIVVHDAKASLHPHRVSLDLRSSRFLQRQMASFATGSDPWVAAGERILALHRRPLLADDADFGWLAPLRAACERDRRRVAEALVNFYRSTGASDAAARVAAMIAQR